MPSIIPIPAFADNYIWLLEQDGRTAVVDPGDAQPVLAYLQGAGLKLDVVLATHHHNDHVGGIPALLARFDVPVYGPANEQIPSRTHAMREGDRARLWDAVAFDVLDIPGHTAGHIAYTGTFGGDRVVFCGDTLFACGCGKLFEGTPPQMWSSLQKLAALPPETRVYCGHEYTMSNIRFAKMADPGNPVLVQREAREQAKRARNEPTLPSTIGDELATNPFLRADRPELRVTAQGHAGSPIRDAVASFAALREWKNRA